MGTFFSRGQFSGQEGQRQNEAGVGFREENILNKELGHDGGSCSRKGVSDRERENLGKRKISDHKREMRNPRRRTGGKGKG
jgi:hypothetical protein